ncbi:MAG: PAS domain S-box protein [Luteitalea sp.]|nr:PAS domain S-box protein [Luteitalea sp.]
MTISTRAGRGFVRLVTPWALALALGLLGGVLNQFGVPLLTTEAPAFVFGTVCAWLAFFWCGRLPGVLAALTTALVGGLSLASWTMAGATGLGLLVFEAWAVTTLATRSGSVVVGAMAFWLLAGAPALFAGQWLAGDVSGQLVALGLVVRVCNALINGVLVELLVRLAPLPHSLHHIELAASTTLEHYIVRRILPVVVLPLLGIGLFHMRARFETLVEQSRLDALASSEAVVSALRRHLHPTELALARLARDVASGPIADSTALARRLDAFLTEQRPAVAIALIDANGRLASSIPLLSRPRASPLDVRASWRVHFDRARRLQEPVFSAFVPDLVPASALQSGSLVTLAWQPLARSVSSFDGLVLVALDSQPLLSMLNKERTDRQHIVTVTDTAGAVVASLDPMLVPGMLLRQRVDERPRWYGAEQREPLSGWRVRVTLAADVLHARLARATTGVLALAAGLLAGLYLVVLAMARHIASPLATLRQTTASMAAGEFERQPATLAASPIRELRSISTDLRHLQTSLQSYDRMRRAREQETEARLRCTFEQAAVGLAHASLQGIWLRVNTRLCEILGYTADDLLGRGIEIVLQPEDRGRVDERVGRVITGQEAITRVELALVGGDGRSHWTQFTVSLGRDAADEPAYLILVLEDMSARRALEEQLGRSQKLESVGRLAGGVAHDFNNLLTAIVGHSDFLHDSLGPDDQRRHDVEQVRDAARRAANLTRQLLAFARQQVLEPRVLNVNELASRMHGLLERLIGEDIDLRLELESDLCNVNADAGQLEQVLLNLVVNARDAMPRGGVLRLRTANVRLDMVVAEALGLDPGEYVQLTVADSGHGMSEDVRARVFEPFFTTKGTDRGTGLGLATCYGIVKQLGGDIDVESAPGRGALFRILLPATREPIQALHASDVSPRRGGGEHIMLVEDEQTVSRLAARTLRQQGYKVLEASDGVEALECLSAVDGRVDVLVTDLVMPRMGGQELALHARALHPDIRVVFISGYLGDAAARLDLRGSGAVFLQKPFRPRTLVQVVQAVLDTVCETVAGG